MRFRFFLLSFFALYVFSSASLALEIPSAQKSNSQAKKTTVSKEEIATVITADKVEGTQGQEVEATGNAELRKGEQSIRANRLRYLQESNEVFAEGAVRIEQEGGIMSGPSLKLNLDTQTGEMAEPQFSFIDSNMRGSASVMHVEGKQNYSFERAIYTSCPLGNDDWLLKMGELELDRNTQIGTSYNTRVEFLGVPILYTPWMNFPLNDRRRSGLLSPTYGRSNTGGIEITTPVYWNIAPNYDATFSPRYIEKRGTLLSNEFRFLGESYSGKVEYESLSNDQLAKRDRSRAALVHGQNFGGGLTGSLNYNVVSDDAYFRDLSLVQALAVQRPLPSEAGLAYSGGWWTASARAQTYQTLQDPVQPVAQAHRRLPQVNVGAQRVIAGSIATLSSEYVEFVHPTLVNGKRMVLHPSVAYPLLTDPGYYVTPKIGVHLTRYLLGVNNTQTQSSFERAVPIMSVDSGMTLERDFSALEREYVQTLEPRIFYVKVPFREQTSFPLFDTAPSAFSFSQIFTENRFLGNDRIGDADQVTSAVTTRFLDADNGIEKLRVAVARRFSREAPRVILGAPTATTNRSDVLLSVSGRLSNTSFVDSLVQYNPEASRVEMFAASTRYKPEPGRVFNLGYRYTFNADPDPRKTLRQVDASTQWQIGGRWNLLAQTKYSIQERRSVDTLLGFEYHQACWSVRVGAQKFVTATQEVRQAVFFQLELRELLNVGTEALATLKQTIPGYSNVGDRLRGNPQ